MTPQVRRAEEATDRYAALRLIVGQAPSGVFSAFERLQALLADDATDHALYVLGSLNAPTAALLAITTPGRTMLLAHPGLAGGQDDAEVEAGYDVLLQAALSDARKRNLAFVQLEEPHRQALWHSVSMRHGFSKLAEIARLVHHLDAPSSLSYALPPGFSWIHQEAESRKRLIEIIEATYVGTLDCPELDAVRGAADSLTHLQTLYRGGLGQWWLLIDSSQDEGRAAGVLFHVYRSEDLESEIVYLGLRPDYRGRWLSRFLVRKAIEIATAVNSEHLVLDVDTRNLPALAAYAREGFEVTASYSVYWLPLSHNRG